MLIEDLVPNKWFVPNKVTSDMYRPGYLAMDITLVNSDKKPIVRFWYAEIIKLKEESIFVTVGNMLYVFNRNEQIAWFNKISEEVEGYETIDCNSLAFSNLHEVFISILEDLDIRYGSEETTEVTDMVFEELALLFVGCTNTEFANSVLNVTDLILNVGEITGYNFEHIQKYI